MTEYLAPTVLLIDNVVDSVAAMILCVGIDLESENQLPFLDVLVRREGNRLRTSVYRKPTHTDRYINFNSHHHPRVLRGTIQCLKDRVYHVCDSTSRTAELKHLHGVFAINGYPFHLTRKTLKSMTRQHQQVEENKELEKESYKPLFLPYVKRVSEKIKRLCHPLGVRAIFKSQNTLRQMLMKVKSTRPAEQRKGVIYEVPCADYDSVYVGEKG